MLIIPAIDIKNGKCVRLTQGDFESEKVYGEDPVTIAKQWEEQGAQMLHIVDLDGAKSGNLENLEIIKNIAQSVAIPVQVGGGIRNEQTIDQLLSIGIRRIVLGTLALEDEKVLKTLLDKFGENIIVSLDSKNGRLVQKGWKEDTGKNYIITALELQALGVKGFIYTDIIKDGTLTSPNFTEIKHLIQNTTVPIIVGGGISSLVDIKKLSWLRVEGAIIGKALYENKFTLKEAINVS